MNYQKKGNLSHSNFTAYLYSIELDYLYVDLFVPSMQPQLTLSSALWRAPTILNMRWLPILGDMDWKVRQIL